MEEKIRQATKDALLKAGAGDVDFVVEWPADLAHGDFAVNAALAAAKHLAKNPRELASELAPLIKEALGKDASRVEVAGPGFINITLSKDAVREGVATASEEDMWGGGDANTGKRIMVEYTQPNPFKEMHIGHLMSNIIGESVSRLIEFSGATVSRANYQGDVGPHVARAIWGLIEAGSTEPATAAELGKAYAHGSRAYEESEKAKAEIDALNLAIYKGEDRELMELWRKGRAISLEAFEVIYKKLGTKFDYYFFESEVAESGTELVKKHTPQVFTESDGAVIYEGEKKGLHTLVFITSRGTPTYEAKELGLAFLKEERWPSDLSLICTSVEQIGHFKVVKAALEDVAPALGAKTLHIPNGFLRLTSGKMSSRTGNVITGESLITDVIEEASKKNDDPLIAEQVALAAIKYMILRAAPGGDIIFDPEKSLSLDGDSGPYLQYAYVRAKKIVSYESEGAGTEVPDEPYVIERILIRFPEVVLRAERERAPHYVTQYLTELASAWNSFYASEQVLGSPEEAYKQRVAKAFMNTMKNGLWLLGIPVPEKM
ncbi:arginine--tRNA ligase [Candidatus Parcubacteria bacterium]|nr:arginine--tRNA ligase [Candidatus Parcubacteria bacterium]